MSGTALDFHTFKNGRKCLKCKKPIADQEHGTRKYCRSKKLPDGSVESCKDDYHSPLRKVRNEPFKRIGDFHKLMHYRISLLFKNHGADVTLELLNRYGIMLNRPLEIDMKNGLGHFYFHEFAVQKLDPVNYKITKHGRKLF